MSSADDAQIGSRAATRPERRVDPGGVLGGWGVVHVELRRREVRVAHPSLDGSDRVPGARDRGAERVAQIVEVERRSETRADSEYGERVVRTRDTAWTVVRGNPIVPEGCVPPKREGGDG